MVFIDELSVLVLGGVGSADCEYVASYQFSYCFFLATAVFGVKVIAMMYSNKAGDLLISRRARYAPYVALSPVESWLAHEEQKTSVIGVFGSPRVLGCVLCVCDKSRQGAVREVLGAAHSRCW